MSLLNASGFESNFFFEQQTLIWVPFYNADGDICTTLKLFDGRLKNSLAHSGWQLPSLQAFICKYHVQRVYVQLLEIDKLRGEIVC